MHQFATELFNDLKRREVSSLICIYVATSSVLGFLFGRLIENNQADLAVVFQYQPWICSVFTPLLWAICQESSREFHSTIRKKYTRIVSLSWISLIATTPIWLTIKWLGEPDTGMILSGYVGTAALMATMLAITMAISANRRRPFGSIALGIAACITLTLVGDDRTLNACASWPTLEAVLGTIGITAHYDAMVSGWIGPNNGVYFVLIIWASLSICSTSERHLKSYRRNRRIERNAVIVLLAGGVLALSSQLDRRVDLTSGRLYSLGDASKQVLENLTEPLEIRLYRSKNRPGTPREFSVHGKRVEALMTEIERVSNGQIRLEVIVTTPTSEEEWEAGQLGIGSRFANQKPSLILGAIFFAGDHDIVIPYFSTERERQLEFDIVQTIVSVFDQKKKTIGIIGDASMLESGEPKQWNILSALRNRFVVKQIGSKEWDIDQSIDCLLILQPENLNELIRFEIDQYLLNDGPTIVAVDPFLRENTRERSGASTIKLLANYHIHIPKSVIGDTELMTDIDIDGYPFSHKGLLSITSDQINQKHPLSSQVKKMLLSEAGEVAQIDGGRLKMTPLLSTTASAQTAEPIALSGGQQSVLSFESALTGPQSKRTLSALFTGELNSAFTKPPAWANQNTSRKVGLGQARILVIADLDFLANRNSISQAGIPANDNWAFLVNAIETLSQDKRLMNIEAKSLLSKPLSINEDKRRMINTAIRRNESNLRERIRDVERQSAVSNTLLKGTLILLWPLLCFAFFRLWRNRKEQGELG